MSVIADVKPQLIVDMYPVDLSRKPVRVPQTGAVVIRDQLNNEIALVASLPTGHVIVSKAGDDDFHQRLAEFGVKSRVEVIRA